MPTWGSLVQIRARPWKSYRLFQYHPAFQKQLACRTESAVPVKTRMEDSWIYFFFAQLLRAGNSGMGQPRGSVLEETVYLGRRPRLGGDPPSTGSGGSDYVYLCQRVGRAQPGGGEVGGGVWCWSCGKEGRREGTALWPRRAWCLARESSASSAGGYLQPQDQMRPVPQEYFRNPS